MTIAPPDTADAADVEERVEFMLDAAGTVLTPQGAAGRLGDAVTAGSKLIDLVHSGERSFVTANIAWVADEDGREGNISFRIGRPNGSWLQVGATLENRANRIHVALSLDELRLARRAEAQMRRVVEGSRQGVVVRTASDLLYLNDGLARILGFESHRDIYALGITALDRFVHPADLPLVIERIRARVAGKEAVSHYEIRMLRRDGRPVWVAIAASSIIWDGKQASLSWLTNIDERKHVEADLIKSKEAAEFANRSKTNFLAHMSHELRTPLNAVLGFSQMIANQTFGAVGSPKYVEYAEDIHRSGTHLLDLINDVLDLSKIEAGKLELRESDVVLPDVIAECVAIVGIRARDAKVVLQVELPTSLPLLRADERAVKQVLFNLLSNAVKFTPPGGTVTARACEIPGKSFDLSVADSGIGMTAAEIDVAFAPFGQVDSLQSRKHIGTGLGLPLSRSILRLHGGDISVASEPGIGTTVTARFPYDRVIKVAAAAA